MNEEETAAIEALYLEIFQPFFIYARAALPSDDAALEATSAYTDRPGKGAARPVNRHFRERMQMCVGFRRG